MLGIKEDHVSVRGMEMGKDGDLKCEVNDLGKKSNRRNKKSIETEDGTRQIEPKKRSGRMVACGNEQRAVQAQGYAEQRGEAGTMEMNRRKRVKELTGAEMRLMIVEKNELREVKKARKDAKKMVKLGNIKSIDSYFN
jgi:hypothetical protein